jgi:hypothetical protein
VGDECCVALRYQLARYAYIYEEALAADGIALDNDDGKIAVRLDGIMDSFVYIIPFVYRAGSTIIDREDRQGIRSHPVHQLLPRTVWQTTKERYTVQGIQHGM